MREAFHKGISFTVLANVYAHYVFDLWAHQWSGHARGRW